LRLVDNQHLECGQAFVLLYQPLEQIRKIHQHVRRFELAVGTLDKLKVEPLDVHVAAVIMRPQVDAANACDVYLVKNSVVRAHDVLVAFQRG